MIPIADQLVTFDLDGVLMVNPFARGVFPEVQRRLAQDIPQDGRSEDDVRADVLRRIIARAAELTRSGQWLAAYDWDQMINDVARQLGSRQSFDVAALVQSFCRPGYIDKYDDVDDALGWLDKQAIRLAWVSNGYAIYQQPVLDALGIASYFSDRAAPDLIGKVKPEPDIFQHVLPDTTWTGIHVGDTLAHDIAGAKGAGFVSVWIDRELPESFRSVPLNERPGADGIDAYLQQKVEREFCWEAYALTIPEDIRPDYIIYTLAELRGVLAHMDPTHDAAG